MTTKSAPVSASPQRRWLVGLVTVLMFAALVLGVRWLTAASEGEKCGGATGCESGLVCVHVGVELVSNVVENRRCRQRCKMDADCPSHRACMPIGNSGVRACIGEADLR